MKTFTDLEVWKNGISLLKEVYGITKLFPSDEKYGLTSQIRRANQSILANTAEGFSRISPKDKAYKYIIARGECSEVVAFLLIAVSLGYVTAKQVELSLQLADREGRLLTGLIHSHCKS